MSDILDISSCLVMNGNESVVMNGNESLVMNGNESLMMKGSEVVYSEFYHLYPAVEPIYTKWEKYYDPVPVLEWMQERPFIPLATVACYCVFLILGPAWMKERKSWNCRKVLALWNFSLSLFSAIGMIRTAPHILHNLFTLSLRDNLCADPLSTAGNGSTGFWVQMFIWSKFPELLDTFFLVIHKKQVIFLHWYHHITVLLYCWDSYTTKAPAGVIFAAINYSVHAFMYAYYFLMGIKMKPKWLNPAFITYAQISQMVVGVFVTICSWYYFLTDNNENMPCNNTLANNSAALIMYVSYLLLFLQFFFTRYIKGKRSKSLKKIV